MIDEKFPIEENHATIESNEYEVRLAKAHELRRRGIEPWAENVAIDQTCAEVISHYQENDATSYTVAGRIITMRKHGKSVFAHIADRSGRLQVYLKIDRVGEAEFQLFDQFIDIGDIILCHGSVFKTKTGEISLAVESFRLLSKCLHPLPEKFHGIADQEIKYRQRYLDLMTNTQTRDRFIARSLIIRTMRNFFDQRGFLEVETPMLHPIPGGASARPFITHHNALDMDLYLRISPELYLKRLVVGGLERVYEINRNFRNEGVSTRHNPEFTMVEFYMAYQEYNFIMSFIEELFCTIAQTVIGTTNIMIGEHAIDLSKPFDRLSPAQAIMQYSSITVEDLLEERIDTTCATHNIAYTALSYNKKVFALFEAVAEKQLINPTFIVDYPLELSPLAKKDSKNPTNAARFELFVGGIELSNGFNELNDPLDQAERFKQQVLAHEAGDDEAMHYDADYITALEYALPPTVGVGIGIDRLAMLITNTWSIKEVILFPALKIRV